MKKGLLVLFIAISNCSFCQKLDTAAVYISNQLNQALIYHGTGINLSEGQMWISYGLGNVQPIDTFAFSRDSLFQLEWDGFNSRFDCEHFRDEAGRSFFCIQNKHQWSDFLSENAFLLASDYIEIPIKMFVTESVITADTTECEVELLKMKTHFEYRFGETVLFKRSFSFDVTSQEDSLQAMLEFSDSFGILETPKRIKSGELEFITGKVSYSLIQETICRFDSSNDRSLMRIGISGNIPIIHLKKKDD